MEKVLSQTEARIFAAYAKRVYRLKMDGGFMVLWRKTPEDIVERLAEEGVDITPEWVCEVIGRGK